MSDAIIYLVKVMIIQGLGLGVYRWLFARTMQHGWNRAFLLCFLLGAFVIPFIQTPVPVETENWAAEQVVTLTHVQDEMLDLVPTAQNADSSASLWPWIGLVYLLIVVGLLVRSVVYLFFIQRIKKQAEYVKRQWYKLYKTALAHPFSFFSNVFIPEPVFDSRAFDQILAHECVHVKQRHSLDRLLLDFLVSLFWFNPFIYWYRNALIEIHEYQADEAVIRDFQDPIGYQEILYSQLKSPRYSGLVSHFNFSMIKKRIVMINKHKNKHTAWTYLALAPLTLIVIFAFSSKSAIRPIENVSNQLTVAIGPVPFNLTDLKFPAVTEILQKDYTPSILPISDTKKVRLSSGFGMRIHPITEEKKLHHGADFAAPKGTPVIATADGKVIEVKFEKNGYGHFILIEHGDQYKTRYAQLSETEVKVGHTVSKGQQIGKVGSSGQSTAPHLHYEVIKAGEGFVDPELYIKDYSFEKPKSPKGQSTGMNIPSISPVKSESVEVASGFGYRMDPIIKVKRPHHGIDFKLPVGESVYATADGKVVTVQDQTGGYGRQIIVEHESGFKTRYAHLSEFLVQDGDMVESGQVIAKSGNTGKSTMPHLHYEVMDHDQPVDPLGFIHDYDLSVPEKATTLGGMQNDTLLEQEQQRIQAEQKRVQDEVRRSQEEIRSNQEVKREVMEAERQRMAEERQRLAEERQLVAREQQKVAQEQQRIAEEMQREARLAQKQAEQLEQQARKNKDKNKDKNKQKNKKKD